MRELDKTISELTEDLFPDFYKEEGPVFVLFAKEYYRFLEESEQAVITKSRSLFEYGDIDKTIDDFLIHFREKYLVNINFEALTSKRTLVKAALDLYRTKGTERSIDLLFKLLFSEKIEIYYPGRDILKVSAGVWDIPQYIELTQSTRTIEYVGKQINGSISNATGFVEYMLTRNIAGKFIDVLYISNVTGTFVTGDIVTDNGIVENAPKIIGSLSTIDITTGGELFELGEIVRITSDRGTEGLARVDGIITETGLVRFALVDGGWGYSSVSNVEISQKVFTVNNRSNANSEIDNFFLYETVSQPLFSANVINTVGNFSVNQKIKSPDSESIILSFLQIGDTPNSSIVVNVLDGTFTSNSYFRNTEEQWFSYTRGANTFIDGETITEYAGGISFPTTGTVANSFDTVSLHPNTVSSGFGANGVHVGEYVIQPTTGASGVVAGLSGNSSFNYTSPASVILTEVSGTFSNTGNVNIYPSSANLTQLDSFTPELAEEHTTVKLTGVTNNDLTFASQWFAGNVAIGTLGNQVVIKETIDPSFKLDVATDISATANVTGANDTHLGVHNINNTFYGGAAARVTGLTSNTVANLTFSSTGQGANAFVGEITDTERVILSPDTISQNTTGQIPMHSMSITGAGSNVSSNNITTVVIFDGGSGYSNSDVIQFVGGTYTSQAANGSITTNGSGVITSTNFGASVGNYSSPPTVNVVTSTGSSANLIAGFALGFTKQPAGELTFPLIDLLRFESRNIGTIATLTGINPGENYNEDPFVRAYEPFVAAYGNRDFKIEIHDLESINFVQQEIIEQVQEEPRVLITANADFIVGNASPTSWSLNELVTQASANVSANNVGLVDSVIDDTDNNRVQLIIIDQDPDNSDWSTVSPIIGSTSLSTINPPGVLSVNNYTQNILARAVVKTSNSTVVTAKRISLFTEFQVSDGTRDLIGKASGARAQVLSSNPDPASRVAGDNANVTATVINETGSLSKITVVDSGFGYEQDETVTISSDVRPFVGTGKVNLQKSGEGLGRYVSADGFISDNKFIHDGDYYQEYSYEVQSILPLSKYESVLKDIIHVAGTKLFGNIKATNTANTEIMVIETSLEIA